MAYLLDSGVFIRAKRDHYRFGTFPCFWDWIIAQHASGKVYSVRAVEREILAGGDDLSTWIGRISTAFLDADAATASATAALSTWAQGQARAFTQPAITTFFASADYWLIAHAAAHGHIVVTQELPEPNRKSRIKIPDACAGASVPWVHTFDMLQNEAARFG